MELRHLDITDRSAWDSLVSQTSTSGFMQSWAWSRFKENDGQRVFRLGLIEEGRIFGGATIYAVPSSLGGSPLMAPHGPILPWDDVRAAEEGMRLLRDEAGRIAQEMSSPMLRIEPMVSRSIAEQFFPEAKRAPIDLLPTPTLIVDITREDKALLAGMKSKGRYNVRLALDKGVEVESGVAEGLVEEFHELFELTCARHQFSGERAEFFRQLVVHLGHEDMARVFVARYRGMTLSAAVVVFCGDTATYLYGGSSPFLRGVMASYALHWEIMRAGRARGCRRYDMYGIAPEGDSGHSYARFTAFKKMFGGETVVNAGAQDIYFYEQFLDLWAKQLQSMSIGQQGGYDVATVR